MADIKPIPDMEHYVKKLNWYLQEHYPASKNITAEEWNALFLALMNQGNCQEDTLEKIINEVLPLHGSTINELIKIREDQIARLEAVEANDKRQDQDIQDTVNLVELLNKELFNKADSSELNKLFKSVNYESSTGILTFVSYDGSTQIVDLPLELLIKSGKYDSLTKEIILILANEEEIKIPVGDLVDTYTADENTLTLKDGIFSVKEGYVIDDLNNETLNKPLSANMGKKLNEEKIAFTDVIDNLTSSVANKPLSANQGNIINNSLAAVNEEIDNLTLEVSDIKIDLAKKLSKATEQEIVYGTNKFAQQTTIHYNKDALGGGLAQREEDGRLKVANPTENKDATNKKYVDDLATNLTTTIGRNTTDISTNTANIATNIKSIQTLKLDVELLETSKADDNEVVKIITQNLTESQKAQVRSNIGAGASSFSGNFEDLVNIPIASEAKQGIIQIANDTEASAGTDTLKAINSKQLKSAIENLNSIKILNVNNEAINVTENNVQTVATQYIVDNYGRQPKQYDGLILTFTDLGNDKIQYMFTESTNKWINIGRNDVDLSGYVKKIDVVDSLNSTEIQNPLSANQGKVVKKLIDDLTGVVNGKANPSDIPTNTNQLTNGAGFIKNEANAFSYANLSGKPTLFSGNYNDLSNKPTIPTKTSDLTNDNGFITTVPIPSKVKDTDNFDVIFSGGNYQLYEAKYVGCWEYLPDNKTLRATRIETLDLADQIFLYIFPVGSYYISDKDPSKRFGGTWELVKDVFLVGAGNKYALNSTGGEATHTLTTSEMPSHTHIQNSHNHSQNAHRHRLQSANNWSHSASGMGSGNRQQVATIENNNGGLHYYDTADNASGRTPYMENTTATNNGTTATNQYTGGGQAHNNLPPYLAVNIWKRTA